MPTKRNRAGNQQEYNESNGEYAEGTSGSGGSTGTTAQTASKTPTNKIQKQSTQQKSENWEDQADKKASQFGWEYSGDSEDEDGNPLRYYDFEDGYVQVKSDGTTSISDKEGNAIEFETIEEAYEFLQIDNREEAEEYVWDHSTFPFAADDYMSEHVFESDKETQADDFDSDLDKAYEKYGGDEDAIIDEMRKKDYGMSNGDLQSVIEAYVLRKESEPKVKNAANNGVDDSDSDETYVMRRDGLSTKEKSFKIRNEKGELEDRNAWAKRIDNTAEQNGWKPYDWDGETSRLYKTPKGWASIYMSGRVELFEKYKDTQWFTSLEEASNYINEDKTNNDTGNKATSKSESAADDFDNDLDKAYEKYDGDENAILDELRKKDYGMSNGDLQSVVEAYVLRKDTDKAKKLFGLKDFVGKK